MRPTTSWDRLDVEEASLVKVLLNHVHYGHGLGEEKPSADTIALASRALDKFKDLRVEESFFGDLEKIILHLTNSHRVGISVYYGNDDGRVLTCDYRGRITSIEQVGDNKYELVLESAKWVPNITDQHLFDLYKKLNTSVRVKAPGDV